MFLGAVMKIQKFALNFHQLINAGYYIILSLFFLITIIC